MDSNSSNSNKVCASFFEGSNNKDSSGSENNWADNRCDRTKRYRSRFMEYNGDRTSFKKHEHSLDESFNEKQPSVQSIQQAATDRLFADIMATINAAWPGNSFDNMAMNQHKVAINQLPIPNLEMVKSSTSNINPYGYMGITGENMCGITGMGNYCQYGSVPAQKNMFTPTIKEVVRLANCVLYPPDPNASRPTTRERPIGCRTVFVIGLPKEITEEIIREIFERCGTIERIWMSKNDSFCHIKFSEEKYIDNALYFSGYRLKIKNRDEAPFTGRLHVDYSQACDDQALQRQARDDQDECKWKQLAMHCQTRDDQDEYKWAQLALQHQVHDDQHEYEQKQLALQHQARDDQHEYERKQLTLQHPVRHREHKRHRIPVEINCTEYGASIICEKLKNEETFAEAVDILITWLEKGKCTKKNAGSFFSMIQSMHNHMKKMQLDKAKYKANLLSKKQLNGVLRKFTEVEKIYKAIALQKCWDQFTKAQRKNIEMWRKYAEELKNALLEKAINEREDQEMDLSDDENSAKVNPDSDQIQKHDDDGNVHKSLEEVNSLKSQLEVPQKLNCSMPSDYDAHKLPEDNSLKSQVEASQNLNVSLSDNDVHKLQEEVNSLKSKLEASQKLNWSLVSEDVHKLQEEVSSLKSQLEASQRLNWSLVTQSNEHCKELKDKDTEISILREALQNSKKENLHLYQKRINDEIELQELRAFKHKYTEANFDNDFSSVGYRNSYRNFI